MKLTTLFLIVSLFQLQAIESYAQKTKVTLALENVSLEKVFDKIEFLTEFTFSYNDNEIDYQKIVSVTAKKERVSAILKDLFKHTNIIFKVVDKHIILEKGELTDLPKNEKALNIQEKPQEIVIAGMVSDVNGQPLPGANVLEKGTTNGVQSDFDGNFSITVTSDDAVLVVSYLGFATKEVSVAGQSKIDVILEEDAAGLDEVVIVGYGSQKRSHITGSIATVGSETLTRTPSTNTSALLGGQLPGLIVNTNSGQPGNDEANISIRGFGQALVVVDGVIRDFQQLDPNEIESVSILKDASAAVYGARAGNGVVLVTTKRGKRNVAPQINYNGSISFQSPTFLPKIANAAEFADYWQRAELLEGVPTDQLTYTDEDIAKYKAGTELGFQSTDWQDLTFRDYAETQQHNINVSGGTDNVNYFTSVGVLDQKSLLETGAGDYERYNISSTVDISITEKLKAGLNLKYRLEDRDYPGGAGDNNFGGVVRNVLQSFPTIAPIPEEFGIYVAANPLGINPVYGTDQEAGGFTRDKKRQLDMVFNLDYELPIEGLTARGQVALKNYDRKRVSLVKPGEVAHDFNWDTNTIGFIVEFDDSQVEVIDWDFSQLTTQFSLNYAKTFGDHNVSAMVLSEYQYNDLYEVGATRKDLVSGDIPYLFSGNGEQSNYDLPYQNGRKSVVSRLNYDYKGKYLIEALLRADSNIQFPSSTRWGYFPGISLGWRISEESFLENSTTIDMLKLRTSYASLGYDDTSDFDYLTGYSLDTGFDPISQLGNKYGYGNEIYQSTLRTLGLANPNITWETMDIYNTGVEAMLWGGKLGVELDVFYRLRSGVLADRESTIPSTFGANLPKENIEKRNNRGFELVLSHKNTIGDFTYGISGNITWAREKYVQVDEREFDSSDPDDARLNQKTGQWVNRFFGYKTDGFYDTQEEIDNDNLVYTEFGEPVLGDIKYIDRNGDGEINYRDQDVIGRINIDEETGAQINNPEVFFGLNMNAQYKGFDFSMMLQGAGDFDVLADRMEVASNLSIGFVPYQYMVQNAWNADNPSAAKLPAPSSGGLNTHNMQPVDIYIQNGSYLRLKSLTFGYTFPESIMSKVKLRKLRVYASAYNLLTLKNNSVFDFDPEGRGGNEASLKRYPVQKSISLGINIGI